jgi:hypothetical protein
MLAVKGGQRAFRCTAQAVRLFQYRVEHWREVAGRRIYDLQDLGGRGLLLQRLGKFSLTLGKPTFEIGYTLLGIG